MKTKSVFKILAVAGIFFTVSLASVIAQDWPQWRGPNRDARVTGFIAPATWPAELKQEWKIPVGFADATPALVNNKLFVFTRQGENEVLQCLDAVTGKQIWQSASYPAVVISGPAASHPGPRSSPVVSGGKVVSVGISGDLACFDAVTGNELWRNEEFKGAIPMFYTGMSPLVISGICIAHLGGPDAGQFVALDLESGKVIWKTAGEGPTYSSPALLTVDDKTQVVFQTLTKLIGLSVTDGTQLWEYATPAGQGRTEAAASPVIDQQKIYYTGNLNGVNAIEIIKHDNGYSVNKLWTNPDFCTKYNTPLLKDGFLYGLSNKNRLFCINASTGQTAWADESVLQSFGSIVDAGSSIIVVSSNSNFVVLNPDGQKYNQVVSIKLPVSSIYAHPILSGNLIYIKDNESLIAYSIK